MRFRIEDDDLRRLYRDAAFHHRQIGPDLARQFRKAMQLLAAAADQRDLYNLRGLRLEKLAGARTGQHSIRLNDQFRLVLRFETDERGPLLVIVELADYH